MPCAMHEGSDRLFPLVVDTVGAPASMKTALEHLEVGGSILVLGLDSRPLQLTAQALVRRQATIRGSLTYDHPGDFEATVALVADGHVSARSDRHRRVRPRRRPDRLRA